MLVALWQPTDRSEGPQDNSNQQTEQYQNGKPAFIDFVSLLTLSFQRNYIRN